MLAYLTRFSRRTSFALACVLLLTLAGVVAACETPVFRYAMYRWSPTPYEVYYFHDKATDATLTDNRAAPVAEQIRELSEKGANRANLKLIPVDLGADPELNGVPPDVKKAWEARAEKKLPAYSVFTPYGVKISSDQLDEKGVADLVESPARQELAKHLEAGKVGVFVLLSGQDKQENEQAESILKQMAREVAAGEFSLYVSPSRQATEDESKSTDSSSEHELGIVRVERDNQSEQWFVRTLLAMEPDLKEEQRAMVFLVYGRGRALLPYIGAGITRENLVREVEFISGACSCTVKEQNPGVDLLVRYDWDAAAASVADKFGSEEGNETQFGVDMFFPELVIPTANDDASEVAAVATSETAQEEGQDQSVADVASSNDAPSDDVGVDQEGLGPANAEAESAAVDDDPTESTTDAEDPAPSEDSAIAMSNTTSPEESASLSVQKSGSGNSILIVGAGLVVALLVLFGLTFLVMRPQ